jgi:hypothetical protein
VNCYFYQLMKKILFAVCSLALICPASNAAVLYSQPYQGTAEDDLDVSSGLVADDFTLASQSILSGFRVWIAESGLDGVADNFSGTLGWAIYDDASGSPGTLLYSGADYSPVVQTTGNESAFGSEIFTVDVTLTGVGVLSSGAYWLSIRDGAWGAPEDGTVVGWSSHFVGAGDQQLSMINKSWDTGTTTPAWTPAYYSEESQSGTGYWGTDAFFELQGEAIPEPSAFLLAGLGLAAAATSRRRK